MNTTLIQHIKHKLFYFGKGCLKFLRANWKSQISSKIHENKAVRTKIIHSVTYSLHCVQ